MPRVEDQDGAAHGGGDARVGKGRQGRRRGSSTDGVDFMHTATQSIGDGVTGNNVAHLWRLLLVPVGVDMDQVGPGLASVLSVPIRNGPQRPVNVDVGVHGRRRIRRGWTRRRHE